MESDPELEASVSTEISQALPKEPLQESAALMHEMALSLCEPDCVYYHSAWQYLRALGLFSTLGGQAEFFVNALTSLAARGEWPRVLVAGTADYSMPAHVYHAYLNVGAQIKLTVLDRCRAPLSISSWYAERIGQPIEVVQQDLLRPDFQEKYDVIVTSSLLGSFDDAARIHLLGALATRLRTGGKLILANAVAAMPMPARGFDEAAAARLASRARLKASEEADALGFDPEIVEKLALEYARGRKTQGPPSADGLSGLVTGAGFEIDNVDEVGNREVALKEPTVSRGGLAVRLVATKV